MNHHHIGSALLFVTALFLASSAASYLTGQTIAVDVGYLTV